MNWWVLTYLSLTYTLYTLSVHAKTNNTAYCSLTWDTLEPTREPIWRIVRGRRILCGYRYIWHNPKTTTQQEPGLSTDHHFTPSPLYPGQTVWFYIWSFPGPYGREVQSPLLMAIIPEVEVCPPCDADISLFPPAPSPPIPAQTVQLSLEIT